jgi:hypothetical protein
LATNSLNAVIEPKLSQIHLRQNLFLGYDEIYRMPKVGRAS